MFELRKAERKRRKLRMALTGPSGSGKTFTALTIAKGMGAKKVAVLDTEAHSSELYADDFDFYVVNLQSPTVDEISGAMKACAEEGVDFLILDSMTHAWRAIIEQVDKLTRTKYKGNKMRAWSEGTPMYKKFLDAIMSYPGNVICTMRVKTEYVRDEDGKGKGSFIKVGLTPEVKSQSDYEYDIVGSMNQDHDLYIEKTRYRELDDLVVKRPDEKFADRVKKVISQGISQEEADKQKKKNDKTMASKVKTIKELNGVWESFGGRYNDDSDMINHFKALKKKLPVDEETKSTAGNQPAASK